MNTSNSLRSQLTLPLVLSIIVLVLLLSSGLWLLIYGSKFVQQAVVIPSTPSPASAQPAIIPVSQSPTAL